MRYRRARVHHDTESGWEKVLWETALQAEQKKQSVDFLKGILTKSEQLMLGRRLTIARMLLSGIPHDEIRLQLQVSPNMICRINEWVTAQIPEYSGVLERIAKEKRDAVQKKKAQIPWYRRESALPFVELRRKYPLHFLFFNIADELLVRRRNKLK